MYLSLQEAENADKKSPFVKQNCKLIIVESVKKKRGWTEIEVDS
jgi:hypothetical protein